MTLDSLDFVSPRMRRLLVLATTVALFALGSAYLAKGTYHLLATAGDFRLRWVEQHYVFRGKNPLDIWERVDAEKKGLPAPVRDRDTTLEPDLGPTLGAYPPWAYVLGAVLTFPDDFKLARVSFTCLNLILIGLLVLWGYRAPPVASRPERFLVAASVFATASICTTLGLGQYGVVILSALVFAYVCEQRDRWLPAGLLMGLALTKVTLSAPFLIPLVLRGRWKTVGVALTYVVLSSLVIWAAIDTDPISMTLQMLRPAEGYVSMGYSLLDGATALGVPTPIAIKGSALVTLAVATPLFWLWRRAPLDVAWALAGTTSRLWTYHNQYDNLIEIVLMVALAVRAPHSRAALAGFVIMGLTLWLPSRATDVEAFRVAQLVAWPCCTALLLALTPRHAHESAAK